MNGVHYISGQPWCPHELNVVKHQGFLDLEFLAQVASSNCEDLWEFLSLASLWRPSSFQCCHLKRNFIAWRENTNLSQPSDTSEGTRQYAVSPGYFDAMSIPLKAGRLLDERDRAGAPAMIHLAEARSSLCTLFLILRTINRYGDPTRWRSMGQPLRTVLSFLNCTKYPGPLDFLLMILGPALLLLSLLVATRLGLETL